MLFTGEIQNFVEDLGSGLGAPAFRLNDQGGTSWSSPTGMVVEFQYWPDNEELVFWTDLGSALPGSEELTYGILLRANLSLGETAGSTFSLKGENPAHVLLARAESWQHRRGRDLASSIEALAVAGAEWSEFLKKPELPDEDADDETLPDFSDQLK